MSVAVLRHPTGLIPVLMSVAALALVLGYAALVGTAPQRDEGTVARIWQLLMIGQLPVIGYFALRWLPIEPRPTLVMLGVQCGAALAAAFPVWWLGW
jgi:hypothetical protein